MGLFRKKINVVVKKRTPDIIEYPFYTIFDKNDANNSSTRHFASPLYGKDVKDEAIATRKSSTPITAYNPYRETPIEKRKDDDPFPEFRKVRGTAKPKENPVKTVDVPLEAPKIEETVKEPEEKKETLFVYDNQDSGEKPKIDSTVISDLFGIEPEEKKEKVANLQTKEKPLPEENTAKITEVEGKNISKSVAPTRFMNYKLPPLNLLDEAVFTTNNNDIEWNNNNIAILNKTLADFRVDGQVKEYTQGPTFTRYAIILGSGVSGSKVEILSNDIQRALSATTIRIENPIPGKIYVGIEVPNIKRRNVHLRELLETKEFEESKDPLLVPVGLDVEGKGKYTSISDWPHGLVAGSSGSGKSVFLACMITALLYKNTPDDLRFFFIDPKKVDLQQFKDIPHLIAPIVDDVNEGIASFKWLIDEMERRFTLFNLVGGVTKLKEYNELAKTNPSIKKMPYIVVVIEEAGDFLMNGGNEATDLITKLVQKSRAAGIHIILAMQKPVAKILSTAIKSNASGRFAFRVTSMTDSMIILDTGGAEKLLGNGDMMFYLSGAISRYQSAFVSVKETTRVREYITNEAPLDYLFNPPELIKKVTSNTGASIDELFDDIARYVVNNGRCSINAISQEFNIGFNRANSIVESLEYYGIVSKSLGTKARGVLIQPDGIEEKLHQIEG